MNPLPSDWIEKIPDEYLEIIQEAVWHVYRMSGGKDRKNLGKLLDDEMMRRGMYIP